MKCTQIQEWIGLYFDLPEEDERRRAVDLHIQTCESCKEEWTIWNGSLQFLAEEKEQQEGQQNAHDFDWEYDRPVIPVASRVMDQIYEKDAWRVPVADRMYSLPYKVRRNLITVFSLCLALFVLSFLYTLANPAKHDMLATDSGKFGLHQAASASSPLGYETRNVAMQPHNGGLSLIEPLKLGPLQTNPNYWMVISILGVIGTLLIMNWLSRIRS